MKNKKQYHACYSKYDNWKIDKNDTLKHLILAGSNR